MLKTRTPANGPPWLPDYDRSVVALFGSQMARPFWLWGAATADLPTLPGMGANEGALAYDDTLNTLTFFNATDWLAVWGIGESAADARSNLGLAAGGAGDIWVEKAGDTMSGTLVSSKQSGATTVLWLNHDPTITGTVGSAAGNVGGFKFGFNYVAGRFTNGPGGEPNYINDVWSIGSNVGASSDRIDTSKASLGITWESKFYQGGVFAHEWHLQGYTAAGATYRPMSFFVAHNGTKTDGSVTTHRFDFLSAIDGAQLMTISSVDLVVDMVGGLKHRYAVNNVAVASQLNAAGNAYVNLPYRDLADVTVISGALLCTGPRAGAAAVVPGSFLTLLPSANVGDTAITLLGPTLAGAYNGVALYVSASGIFKNEFTNQGAGNSQVRVGVEGAGDPVVYFDVSGGAGWTAGIDNSDSDAFVIAAGSVLGSTNALRIDFTTLQVQLQYPPKLPSSTVAGLPVPSTAGAGAMIRCSNEAGGACTLECDATNWRRVRDLVIAS